MLSPTESFKTVRVNDTDSCSRQCLLENCNSFSVTSIHNSSKLDCHLSTYNRLKASSSFVQNRTAIYYEKICKEEKFSKFALELYIVLIKQTCILYLLYLLSLDCNMTKVGPYTLLGATKSNYVVYRGTSELTCQILCDRETNFTCTGAEYELYSGLCFIYKIPINTTHLELVSSSKTLFFTRSCSGKCKFIILIFNNKDTRM